VKPLFDRNHATERVAAAVQAARALPFPFTLTARAEGFLRGKPDLDDVIKRLKAFEKAGADVLMSPGLPDLAAVRTVCSSLSKPFNFMAGRKGKALTRAGVGPAGVEALSLAHARFREVDDGVGGSGARGEGEGDVQLHRSVDGHAGPERLHARLAGIVQECRSTFDRGGWR